jgi:3-deoxy-manno-octulosonate cytidylyltransferase (CMP-KDO synthetase)
MNIIGIIPARYGSTRFPGKPLVDIFGKPMIQHVYDRATQVLDNVVVATDDKRIVAAVEKFGGNVIMTSKRHKSGTDRCAEAADIYIENTKSPVDVVVNIQGDEPFIYPEQISLLVSLFNKKRTQIATLVKPIINTEDIFNKNKPKVIFNNKMEAIYFSRSPIPFVRGKKREVWVNNRFFKHIGIYGYRYDILKKITKLQPSYLEKMESLEQLRWIENGFKIKVGITEYESVSVDTRKDLKKIQQTGII